MRPCWKVTYNQLLIIASRKNNGWSLLCVSEVKKNEFHNALDKFLFSFSHPAVLVHLILYICAIAAFHYFSTLLYNSRLIVLCISTRFFLFYYIHFMSLKVGQLENCFSLLYWTPSIYSIILSSFFLLTILKIIKKLSSFSEAHNIHGVECFRGNSIE